VNPAVQESTRSDDHSSRAEASAFESLHAEYTCFVLRKQEPRDGPLHGAQACMFLEERPYCAPVEPAITLSARRPDRWTLAPIEHAELEHGEIGSSAHYSAERIHLPYDGSLCNPADCRVARHLADRLERASDEPDSSAQASCADRGFSSGVTGPDDNYIEFGLEILWLGHTLKISIRQTATQLVSNRT
jgi:hypothetical protein